MIDPLVLRDRLNGVAQLLNEPAHSDQTKGQLAWDRVFAWTKAVLPVKGERGGGVAGGATDLQLEERLDDRKASRYHDELKILTKRMDADLARLAIIIDICTPPPPRQLGARDLLVAQVVADGWCGSCWRDEQNLTAITVRPEKDPAKKAQRFYKDLCRPCGDWKREHGALPPLSMLQAWHSPSGRVTVADMAKAIGN